MLFSKISRCSKTWFVGPGFFLFNTEDNYNATKQPFVVKDFVISGFKKSLHVILFLGGS